MNNTTLHPWLLVILCMVACPEILQAFLIGVLDILLWLLLPIKDWCEKKTAELEAELRNERVNSKSKEMSE